MKTKFGNAKLNNCGRYQISSRNEGNHGKLLHRLIWEDFYNKSVPKGCVIHHKDGNPLNNEIWNLQCCEGDKHMAFHGKMRRGKNHPFYGNPNNYHPSEETKKKMSEAKTGENHPMFGKHHSEESKKKISEAKKGKYAGENNPRYRHDLPSNEDLLNEYFDDNCTMQQLADKYGVVRSTIYRRLKNAKSKK